MTKHKWLAPLLALFMLAVGVRPAAAQTDAEKVERLFAEGAALYRAGKYRPAIEKFDEAYAIYPEPNLLYNKARAHEALGEIEQAMAAYQACAAAPDADPAVKAKAKAKAEMLAQAKRTSKLTPAGAPSGAEAVAGVTAPAPKERGSGLTVTKWAVTGLAGALAVGGAVFYALGASDHSKVNSASSDAAGGVASLTLVEAQDLSDSGATKKTLGVGLLGGAAAAAAGAALLFVMDGPDDEGTKVSVGITPDGVGVAWMGSF